MSEEAGAPERTVTIQVAGGTVTKPEVQELVDGITNKVGEAVETWQERMKKRAAAQAATPFPPCG